MQRKASGKAESSAGATATEDKPTQPRRAPRPKRTLLISVLRILRAIAFLLIITLAAAIVVVIDIVVLAVYSWWGDPTRFLFHKFNAITARIALYPFISVDIEGRDNLPTDRAFVFAANHQSALDAFILGVLQDVNFKCTFKQSLLFYPALGQAFWLAKHISVKRGDKDSAQKCMDAVHSWLLRGVSVLFFPEGTRKVDGALGPFKSGAFRAALRANVPIVPVTISGARDLMPPRGFPSLGWGRVTLIIHPPIEVEGKTKDQLSDETRVAISNGLRDKDI